MAISTNVLEIIVSNMKPSETMLGDSKVGWNVKKYEHWHLKQWVSDAEKSECLLKVSIVIIPKWPVIVMTATENSYDMKRK